jgi:DNA-directed RNA polymerase specialized sigma24 family protein
VSYESDPASLPAEMKFKLALKVSTDPVTATGVGLFWPEAKARIASTSLSSRLRGEAPPEEAIHSAHRTPREHGYQLTQFTLPLTSAKPLPSFDAGRCPGVYVDLIAVHDALNRLACLDPQQSRIVELRFFGGLSIEETAEVLGLSPATVKRHWSTRRVWLHHEMRIDRRT